MMPRTLRPVFVRPQSIAEIPHTYCPGCSHGVTQRLIAEVLDELGLRDRCVAVIGNGCYTATRAVWNFDLIRALHGRAPATATGVKRMRPDRVVFTVQGDGDLASIGAAEILHAAQRGEQLAVFFLNNAGYGMTGGQLAPTTLLGQKTSTSAGGRRAEEHGFPTKIVEMLTLTPGTSYVARVAVNTPARVGNAKRIFKRAFRAQLEGLGLALVEVLSACPTDWGLTPVAALKWVEDQMIPANPLGELKVPSQWARGK